jgi:transcriptional regulator with XRE-family HTH domain
VNPTLVKDELKSFLNSGEVTLAQVVRETSLSRSWLSKFRRGEIQHPRADQLGKLYSFRESLHTAPSVSEAAYEGLREARKGA